MTWRTHPLVVRARAVGRRVGLNRVVASLVQSGGYEDRFQSALLKAVRPGDCVWDVGANVGYYTAQFSDLVGARGHVIAFEPSPINFDQLRRAVGDRTNVTLVSAALGAQDGRVALRQGDDPLGATSTIVDRANGGNAELLDVKVCRGDQLVVSGEIPAPEVIKIDTEGHELDVLRGLSEVLRRGNLRQVCIEVHFGLLDARGLSDGAAQIETLIQEAGFRSSWPDPSHVVAAR